jgi:hypothetical protein
MSLSGRYPTGSPRRLISFAGEAWRRHRDHARSRTLIWSVGCQAGRGYSPAVLWGWVRRGSGLAVVDVCVATHMRGLVPHDRVCETRSGAVCLASSVAAWGCSECSLGSLLASLRRCALLAEPLVVATTPSSRAPSSDRGRATATTTIERGSSRASSACQRPCSLRRCGPLGLARRATCPCADVPARRSTATGGGGARRRQQGDDAHVRSGLGDRALGDEEPLIQSRFCVSATGGLLVAHRRQGRTGTGEIGTGDELARPSSQLEPPTSMGDEKRRDPESFRLLSELIASTHRSLSCASWGRAAGAAVALVIGAA